MKTSRRIVASLLAVFLTLETSVALAQTSTTWGRLKTRYQTESAVPGPGVTAEEARSAWETAVRLNRFHLTEPGEVTRAGVVEGEPVFLVTGRTREGDPSAQVITSGGDALAGAVLDLSRGELVDFRDGSVIWKTSADDPERAFVDFTQSMGFQDFAKRVVAQACTSAAGFIWGKCATTAGPNVWGQMGCFVAFLALLALCDLIQNVKVPDEPECGSSGTTTPGNSGPTLCY